MTTQVEKYTFHVGKDKPNTKEKVDPDRLAQAVAQMFPESGANIQEQQGTWKGKVESGSWRIEHIDMNDQKSAEEIEQMRQDLEEKFNQDMVLVTSEEVEVV